MEMSSDVVVQDYVFSLNLVIIFSINLLEIPIARVFLI